MRIAVWASLALLAIAGVAEAQDQVEQLTKQLFEQPALARDPAFMSRFKRMAAQNSLRAIPPELKKQMDTRGRAVANMVEHPRKSGLDAESPKIIRHITAEAGIPFPPPPSGANSPIKLDQARVETMLIKMAKHYKEANDKALTAPALPECDRDVTIQNTLPKPGRAENKDSLLPPERPGPTGLIQDLLFLADKAPVDAQEIFGRRTKVVQYKPGPKSPVSVIAARIGVICLPYRVRLTDKHLFWHLGKNALRNFDSDPEGKGELHEYMKIKEKAFEDKTAASKKKKGKKHERS